jgi:hypothetical protein
MENAYYSVISPEGCAAILWKDRANAAKAAEALKITARDLFELKLVDEIIPEPLGGAHTNAAATAANLKTHLLKHLEEILALPIAKRLKKRYEKFRAHGHFLEKVEPSGNGAVRSFSIRFSRNVSGADANWKNFTEKNCRPAKSSASRGKFPTGRAMKASSPTENSPEKLCAGSWRIARANCSAMPSLRTKIVFHF